MPETIAISETVLVALITFLSGVVGACVGAITTYLVAKQSSDTELKKALHDERLSAYSELMDSYLALGGYIAHLSTSKNLDVTPDPKEHELYIRFSAACSKAGLLASKPTLVLINELLKAMNHYAATLRQPQDINQLYTHTIDALRNDLLFTKKLAKNTST